MACRASDADVFSLVWESRELLALNSALGVLVAKQAASQGAQMAVQHFFYAGAGGLMVRLAGGQPRTLHVRRRQHFTCGIRSLLRSRVGLSLRAWTESFSLGCFPQGALVKGGSCPWASALSKGSEKRVTTERYSTVPAPVHALSRSPSRPGPALGPSPNPSLSPAGLLSALAPALLLDTASGLLIENAWSVAVERSMKAGKLLARVLMGGGHGSRPVTLLAHSMGARLVFHCLLELCRHDALGGEGTGEGLSRRG